MVTFYGSQYGNCSGIIKGQAVRIISRSTLRDYWKKHADAEQPLKAWFKYAQKADWDTPTAVKRDYVSASVLQGDRVCFNIGGNKYRLIVRIKYEYRLIYIRFVGTHAEYDKVDAHSV
jgi:mRNA interferase HigB